ncbi:unnamed protein product [Ectocarpus sp. 12 AP-2014]
MKNQPTVAASRPVDFAFSPLLRSPFTSRHVCCGLHCRYRTREMSEEAGDGHRSTAAEMGTCSRFCRPLHVSPCCRAPLVVGVRTKPGKLPQHPEGAGRQQHSANHADPDEARVLRHGQCSRSVHVSIPKKIGWV